MNLETAMKGFLYLLYVKHIYLYIYSDLMNTFQENVGVIVFFLFCAEPTNLRVAN